METMLASIDAKLEALGAQIKTDIEKKQQKVALTIAEQRAMLQAKEDMVDLAHATEQAMIQAKQNMVNITQSQLNKEYAVSSNQYIISPFDGIVSKRMANVGDVVSMSMPLYELVNVPTSLAKQAKKEIQF
jgi:multidrug resistance efflux pump